jgi:hypothetical protein
MEESVEKNIEESGKLEKKVKYCFKLILYKLDFYILVSRFKN